MLSYCAWYYSNPLWCILWCSLGQSSTYSVQWHNTPPHHCPPRLAIVISCYRSPSSNLFSDGSNVKQECCCHKIQNAGSCLFAEQLLAEQIAAEPSAARARQLLQNPDTPPWKMKNGSYERPVASLVWLTYMDHGQTKKNEVGYRFAPQLNMDCRRDQWPGHKTSCSADSEPCWAADWEVIKRKVAATALRVCGLSDSYIRLHLLFINFLFSNFSWK